MADQGDRVNPSRAMECLVLRPWPDS